MFQREYQDPLEKNALPYGGGVEGVAPINNWMSIYLDTPYLPIFYLMFSVGYPNTIKC
jgi:hypothetical protein